MKPFKIVILFIFFFNLCNGQNMVDTSKVFLNAKMKLLKYAFSESFDSTALQGFIDYFPETRGLKSTGFREDEVFIFEMHAEPYIDHSKNINFENGIIGNYIYFSNVDFKFIFCYNKKNKSLYLLNDSDEKDFKQFKLYFEDLCSGLYIIENLDLKCLCKRLRKSKINCNFPSLIYDGISW